MEQLLNHALGPSMRLVYPLADLALVLFSILLLIKIYKELSLPASKVLGWVMGLLTRPIAHKPTQEGPVQKALNDKLFELGRKRGWKW